MMTLHSLDDLCLPQYWGLQALDPGAGSLLPALGVAAPCQGRRDGRALEPPYEGTDPPVRVASPHAFSPGLGFTLRIWRVHTGSLAELGVLCLMGRGLA